MTARDEALAMLRNRLPEPWVLSLRHAADNMDRWYAEADLRHDATPQDSVRVHGFGTNPHAAARACIAAWDEATRRPLRAMEEAEAAERELSDRLAEAAKRWAALVPGHRPFNPNRTPQEPHGVLGERGPCACDGCQALAEHAQRRKG